MKGLEDDEAAFLNFVSTRQIEAESARRKEEDAALDEYRVRKMRFHIRYGFLN